jgi:arginine exporter protein ArgO
MSEADKKWEALHPHAWGCAIAFIFLLAAASGYYALVRFAAPFGALWAAWALYRGKANPLSWICAVAVAVLFNPLLPFHFRRQLWEQLDLVAAVLMAIIGLAVKVSPVKHSTTVRPSSDSG